MLIIMPSIFVILVVLASPTRGGSLLHLYFEYANIFILF